MGCIRMTLCQMPRLLGSALKERRHPCRRAWDHTGRDAGAPWYDPSRLDFGANFRELVSTRIPHATPPIPSHDRSAFTRIVLFRSRLSRRSQCENSDAAHSLLHEIERLRAPGDQDARERRAQPCGEGPEPMGGATSLGIHVLERRVALHTGLSPPVRRALFLHDGRSDQTGNGQAAADDARRQTGAAGLCGRGQRLHRVT